MNSKKFINDIQNYIGINVFNPYTDICELYDRKNANKIRTLNLTLILDQAIDEGIDSIWIGRDLGHKGGRRTGIALTDEAHLHDASKKWDIKLSQATIGPLLAERTANNIWDFVSVLDQRIFMWNVFPFHPHENKDSFTNRSHTAKERDDGIELLSALDKLLNLKKIVAIGNDAYNASKKLFSDKSIHKIRHPSYGGEKIFSKQLCDLYNVKKHTMEKKNKNKNKINLDLD